MSLFSPFDLHLFHEGRHERLYEKLGARAHPQRASRGVWFGLWARDAEQVSVIGSFNHWDRAANPLERTVDPSIWEGFVPGVQDGALYKFYVGRDGGGEEIPDPMAIACEPSPGTASVFTSPAYEWHDVVWQGHRRAANSLEAPIAISTGDAHEAQELGFTHVLLPAVRGFAPPSPPPAFKAEIDEIHNHQLGAAAELQPPPGFDGREAQSARLSAAVWWQDQYHLDVLLGRDLLFDQGWSERLYRYLSLDPGQRAGEHHLLTERMAWAFDSTFVLPLTDPLPGGSAVERLALAFLYAMPGKKLVRPPADDGARLLTGQLNHLYRSRPALHQTDPWREGFQWIEQDGGAHGVVAFARTDRSSQVTVLFVANFGPEERTGYRLAVPHAGLWKEALNTDARDYGGAGRGNLGGVHSEPAPWHGRQDSIVVTLPPSSGIFFLGQAK